MSAFDNLPGGGLLIVGLNESAAFRPIGFKQAASLAAGLASCARQALEPAVHVDVYVEQFEASDLVVARVRELPPSAKPCFVKRSGPAYLRFAGGNYAMSQLETDGFITSRTHPRFDEAPVLGATFGDLDRDRVSDYLATARRLDARLAKLTDDAELLVRSGVTASDGTAKIAGLIALGTYPQQFLPHYKIRAAVVLLPDGTDPFIRALDETTLTGPIAAMLEDASAFVARNSRRRLIADQLTGQVRQALDPPAVAVQELLSNTPVHRDLAEWNPGRAPGNPRRWFARHRLLRPGNHVHGDDPTRPRHIGSTDQHNHVTEGLEPRRTVARAP